MYLNFMKVKFYESENDVIGSKLLTIKEMIRGAGPGFYYNSRRHFFMTNN